MDRLLARMLAQSELNGGILTISGLSCNQVKELYEELREALLSCELPHYKIIGVNVVSHRVVETNYITKLGYTNKSYAELNVAFEQLIFAEGDGFEEDDYSMSSLHEYGHLQSIAEKVTSSNGALYFAGKGIDCIAESLINNVEIIQFNDKLKGSSEVRYISCRGCGMLDFKDTGVLLRDTDYKPVRAVYNLYDFISIMLYNEGDTEIRFKYKKNLNEKVFLKILHRYARDWLSRGEEEE